VGTSLHEEVAVITLTSSRRPSYTPLSPSELEAALGQLPGWHGDTARIARTVSPGDLWALLEAVAAVEADLDHHAVVDLDAGTVTFALWTHVCDAVTDADLELARRISAVVDG
jgi:pterin-4a-carbinolamine dehydratase